MYRIRDCPWFLPSTMGLGMCPLKIGGGPLSMTGTCSSTDLLCDLGQWPQVSGPQCWTWSSLRMDAPVILGPDGVQLQAALDTALGSCGRSICRHKKVAAFY